MKCPLCQERNSRRECPAVRGVICALCCGEKREVSLDCPLDCIHLQEAHRFEMGKREPPAEIPYGSHELPPGFSREMAPFLERLAAALLECALEHPGTVDADVREALDALIRTHETLATGLVYETVPPGPLAARLYRKAQDLVAQWRKAEADRFGNAQLRDSAVLHAAVFLARLAAAHNNNRPRGRSLIGFFRQAFPQAAPESPLILGA